MLSGDYLKSDRYVTAQIKIDEVERPILCLYVIAHLPINADVLIGQNFTELADVEYVKSGQVLKFINKIGSQFNVTKSNIIKINEPKLNEMPVNIGIEGLDVKGDLLNLLGNYDMCIAKSAYRVATTSMAEMK